jgi:hypothetical protein
VPIQSRGQQIQESTWLGTGGVSVGFNGFVGLPLNFLTGTLDVNIALTGVTHAMIGVTLHRR